jgi:hypothetical protein
MTKATRQAGQAEGNGGLPKVDYERMMALSSANVEAVMRASEAMLKGIAKLNEELLGFTSLRFKEQVEGGRAIAQCGNWSEALERQVSLARSATEQYLAEASKLASLATEITMASWAPLQSRFQASMGELGRAEKAD